CEPYLLFGPADGLGQGGRWDGDAGMGLAGPGEEHDYAAIAAVQGDQPARVKRDARHQTAGSFRAFLVPSISSAQARSPPESAPPVSRNASASSAPHPATSSRATPTACCTNPDTLGAAPASTRARIRPSWSSSSVMVTFFDAIPVTILRPRIARVASQPAVAKVRRLCMTQPPT